MYYQGKALPPITLLGGPFDGYVFDRVECVCGEAVCYLELVTAARRRARYAGQPSSGLMRFAGYDMPKVSCA